MLRISISSMVFDIVGPLEARTSKFGGLSGARRRLPPAQPVKTTSGHCRVLRFYLGRSRSLKRSYSLLIKSACTRIRQLFDRLIVCHHAQKPENCPSSDLFNLTSKYFLPLLPYTDLVPPSTDPVPPSTNQYCPILTQYHHGSTITALY